jgi:hypothetical protein
MKNTLDKRCTENQSTHFIFNNFFPKNLAVCKIVWKNMVQLDRRNVTTKCGAGKIRVLDK